MGVRVQEKGDVRFALETFIKIWKYTVFSTSESHMCETTIDFPIYNILKNRFSNIRTFINKKIH